jgi:hypothetical protein
MPKFSLLNPHIEGTMKKQFSGKTAHEAADKAWATLSANFSNALPAFYFTLIGVGENNKVGGGEESKNQNKSKSMKQYHFGVKETLGKNQSVKYKLDQLDLKHSTGRQEKFYKSLKAFKNKVLSGGGDKDEKEEKEKTHKKKTHKKDKDSSSSSSSSRSSSSSSSSNSDSESSSSSSSSSDIFNIIKKRKYLSSSTSDVVTWFWYYPDYYSTYYTNTNNSYFAPTWTYGVSPYVVYNNGSNVVVY